MAREILYILKDASGNNLNGYTVTEHMFFRSNGQLDTSGLSGPDGTSHQDPDATGGSLFDDAIGGLGTHDDLQRFTASPLGQPDTVYPVYMIDDNNKAWGTNGIYINSGIVYVNGTLAQSPCR